MSSERSLPPSGIDLIRDERRRQIQDEGYEIEHDDQHAHGELAEAAACYATPTDLRQPSLAFHWNGPAAWPWESSAWKPSPDDRVRELVKAGALIVAEIERLQRIEP